MLLLINAVSNDYETQRTYGESQNHVKLGSGLL